MLENRPLYPISVVSELLNVHPETIRVWERYGIIKPQRRSGKRFYSDMDLKRLRFIQKMIAEQLNLPAIRHYLQLYPCWYIDYCPSCMRVSKNVSCAKPCWKEQGLFCQVYGNEGLCLECKLGKQPVSGNR